MLDLFISTLNTMKYFTNKTVPMKLHWKLYVMSSDDQSSLQFHLKDALCPLDRYRPESHLLGGPLVISAQLWWTLVGSLTS